MSGIVPDQIITLSDMMLTESGATDPYVMLSFPSRVKVKAVSFTVNEAGLGDKGDGLEYTLYCSKGKHARGAVATEEWYEDIVNFFPWDSKPTIVCDADTKFRSNIVAPLESEQWYTFNEVYTADVAQMDTDEYLCIWVENTDGDTTNIEALANGFDDVRFTVSIAYTGATNID